MPNLLAHYGAQGVLTRAALPTADVRWILLGAFLPDVPWVTQRALRILLPAADLHTLRLFAVIQASLFFSLLLAAGLALLARRPGWVFAILSLNVALHLVLDSFQEKWGVGVHLLAPFRWDEWNAELFAMEGWVTYGLTAFGAAFCVWAWVRMRRGPEVGPEALAGGSPPEGEPASSPSAVAASTPGARRLAAAGLLAGTYLLLPIPFLDAALASNTHSVRTLVEVEERPGRPVTADRERYVPRADGDIIVHGMGDTLWLERRHLDRPASVSARGVFVDERTVRIEDLQVHTPYFRDAASYVALLILAAFWLPRGMFRPRRGTGGRLEGSG